MNRKSQNNRKWTWLVLHPIDNLAVDVNWFCWTEFIEIWHFKLKGVIWEIVNWLISKYHATTTILFRGCIFDYNEGYFLPDLAHFFGIFLPKISKCTVEWLYLGNRTEKYTAIIISTKFIYFIIIVGNPNQKYFWLGRLECIRFWI